MKKALVLLLGFVAAASLAANVLLYMRYSSSRPLMRVGSEVISKREFQYAMESRYGKSVLNQMAYEKLIRQAAAKAGVTPTSKDVEARLARIERRTPAVLAEAKRDPSKMDDLKRTLATDLALENVRIQKVKVSDAEVAAFYRRNTALFALPAQAQTSMVFARNAVDASTAAELLRRNTRPDVIARQPRLYVVGVNGVSLDWRRLPAEAHTKLTRAAFKMKPGQVTMVPVGDIFVALRVNKQNGAGVPALGKIKDQVVRSARLQKAPPPGPALAELYKNGNVTFEVDRYAAYFDDIQKLTRQTAEQTASAR